MTRPTNRFKTELEPIRAELRQVESKYASLDYQGIGKELSRLKQLAVEEDDEGTAKDIWCLEHILIIQGEYVEAFAQMKQGNYLVAWRALAQVEVNLSFLARHFSERNGEYRIHFIEQHVARFQKLFPYPIFASPEFVHIRKACTICGREVSLRNPCGHRVFEIYGGEMCGRRIEKAEVLGISLVRHPLNKYAVMLPLKSDGTDPYNYSLVRYAVDRLASPFHVWTLQETRMRHPHGRYRHVGRNDPCPCESGQKYQECCLPTSGVMRPHYEFGFAHEPLLDVSEVEYHD